MNKYQPVIGVEVHVELNTKTKMFCRCSADYFGKEPNTHTCPVCLGLPGALPYINEEAIKKCIQIGLALNCQISDTSLFERKNYFYPDLPKGYQISQYRWPLCIDGKLMLENGKWIRINRVHQEEDTAKLAHQGGESLIDFNRSGVPLVEVVTEPDFSSSEEVREYAQKLQQIFRALGVSNADMERGDMRLEANISLRQTRGRPKGGAQDLPNYRVELKNINSFRFMVAAIEYEIKRQSDVLNYGETLSQETRGWDEDKKETYLQRSKEEAHDYRYFTEPDLPEIQVGRLQITVDSIKKEMPELPETKVERYMIKHGLNKTQANILVADNKLTELFEKVMETEGVDAVSAANYIINKKIDPLVEPKQIITDIQAKTTNLISDKVELEDLAKQAIEENPKAVEDYKKGKENALQVLVGAVMRLSKGKADTKLALEIIKSKLNN